MRKKFLKPLAIASVIAAQIALCLAYRGGHALTVKADQEYTFPRNGQSGTIMLVNGNSTYFNTGEADLAIYCWNSTESAWSEKVSYRCFGDYLRVMIPYKDGVSKTWSKFVVCRYDPNKNPATDGFDGRFNQSEDLDFSDFYQSQNTINVIGYNDGKLVTQRNATYYCGIRGENHIYLDLSDYLGWEDYNAKFAIYFAYPNSTNQDAWSQAYVNGSYQPSFLWKVEGQDNPHLYEGIVPNKMQYGTNIWNLVIAVRFDPVATEPGWNNVWNQTQNLSFNSNNHTANIIHIEDSNRGEFEANSISRADRVSYFGRYFLNTVTCSGTGSSDATTSTEWNNVKTAYNHLTKNYQGDVWTTTADEEGTLIQQAMARYDYIVLYKHYQHEDFINRAESPNKTEYSSPLSLVDNSINSSDYMTVILIISIIMSASVITLIVLKKYKSRKR